MIRKKEDMRLQLRENICNGDGSIECLHLLEKEEMCGKARLCALMTLKPGDSIGLHPHGPDAEIYYILSGEMIGTDNGKEVVLHAGDAMFTANNETHSVKNVASEPAVLLAVVML